MCGFVGFTGLREQREAILHRMADRIIHRGPDMEGYHISGDDPRTAIALGFRRLSIIDLAAGKQPMYNEDGTVVCVFNGEIYNFMDLRTELQAKGHIFKTHCDTEVIIHGYEEYGTALAAKVRKSFMSDVAAEYFDQDKLIAMLADPKHERRKIWTAYTFLTWHEQFFEKFDA